MRRRTVIVVALVAAAVLVAGGLAAWLLTRPAGPEATAAAYLEALSSGDGPAAASLLADPADPDVLGDALAGATSRIVGPEVTSVRVEETDATASATFELSGRPHTAQLTLVRRDGRWLIGPDGLGSATVTAPLGAAATVADAVVDLGTPLPLLPAEYVVSPAPGAVLTGSATVTILPGAALDVAVPAVLSPDATAVAQQQLDAYQDTCTRTAAAVPRDCGLRVPWPADLVSLTQIAWRIEQRPTLALAADGRTFAATGGIVVATATGVTPAGATASFTYRADDWALRGAVTFSRDAMTLAVY